MFELWQDLATTDFESCDPESTLVLLPVAAIEQHGPHLPLGTDLEISRGILTAAAPHLRSDVRVLVLPEQAVGTSLEHRAFAGTLTLSTADAAASWTSIGACVARAGLRKLVILNSHGGQRGLVDQVALSLRVEHAMLVVRASYFSFGTPQGLFDPEELRVGLHGGEVETSMMLHLRPELVRQARSRDFDSPLAKGERMLAPERPVGFGWMSQDLNPQGVVGNAARADSARGQRLLEHLGECLARLLSETAATPLGVLAPSPGRR